MITKLKAFFEQALAAEQEVDIKYQLRLATAALLVEMMNQDHEVRAEEEEAVTQALMDKFGLSAEETSKLFELAREETRNAADLYQFTSVINQHFEQDKKIKVIEMLWQVAYADLHLDSFEEHMIRRVADLLYVSHKDFIQAKHRVQEQTLPRI